MRIAHITATFPPYRGGTGNVCYHNARILASRGHEVHVFTPATVDASGLTIESGIHVHRLRPALRFGNASLLPQLTSALAGFDLIHFHYPFFGGEFAAWAARARRIPLVVTYHQDVLLQGPLRLVEWILRQTAGRFLLRQAGRVMFTTLDYSRVSQIRPLLAGREWAIGEQPNGVDVTHFTPGPVPDGLRQRLGLQPQDQIVLLVAGLDAAHYFKGVHILLEALVSLPDTFKAVIVGDGDLRSQYQAQAAALGLSQRVVFPGRVDDAELPGYYRLADVTVLPSVTMGEAFGLVLVEAMACGTPVIASNLPGVRMVVSDGKDGFLVEPGDPEDLAEKLGMLLNLPAAERHAMGAQGRIKAANNYAWEKVTAQIEGVYQKTLADDDFNGAYGKSSG